MQKLCGRGVHYNRQGHCDNFTFAINSPNVTLIQILNRCVDAMRKEDEKPTKNDSKRNTNRRSLAETADVMCGLLSAHCLDHL
jgi:hypothetical protein